jgi:hypothetical protein
MLHEYDGSSIQSTPSSLWVRDSFGIFAARANKVVKYTAQIRLSAANPAATAEEETPRASETAT